MAHKFYCEKCGYKGDDYSGSNKWTDPVRGGPLSGPIPFNQLDPEMFDVDKVECPNCSEVKGFRYMGWKKGNSTAPNNIPYVKPPMTANQRSLVILYLILAGACFAAFFLLKN